MTEWHCYVGAWRIELTLWWHTRCWLLGWQRHQGAIEGWTLALGPVDLEVLR